MLPALVALTLALAAPAGASSTPTTGVEEPVPGDSSSSPRSGRPPATTDQHVSRDSSSAPTIDAVAAAARDAVARAGLDLRGGPPLADRLRAAGLDAAALVRLLDDLAATCSADACPSLASEPALGPLVDALAAVGARGDAAVLLRLEARGVWSAGRALESILTREMADAVPRARCAPPSAVEIARARADLGDFVVLRDRKGHLVAEALTAGERDDLAYFHAAVADNGPEVGAAEERPGGGPITSARAQPDPEAERLREAMTRARKAGDLGALARSSRAYLERLGFPGPIDVAAEGAWAWGGARFSYVLRDLAEVSELRGDAVLADQLYRRANPGGGMCGSSVSSRWADQVRGAIRSGEQRGECRLAVAERLLDIDGPTHSWSQTPVAEDYGPARLTAAGFDVPRLYRGALLTLHRDRDPAELRELLGRAPEPLRAPALARLDRRGTEAWEARVHAIEGLADTAGAAALPVLVDLAAAVDDGLRPRVLEAIGALAARPESDPCDPDSFGLGGLSFSSQWERKITALGERCETSIRLDDAGALARSLTRWLGSADPETREAAAIALGKIGHRAALPALRRARKDPHRPADVRRCDDRGACHRFYPVREAAAAAIADIVRLSASDRAWRATDAGRRAE